MELKQAKQVIQQAINAAMLKGCYSLEDVKVIVRAMETIEKQPDVEFGAIESIKK